jgi:hypothetical protein
MKKIWLGCALAAAGVCFTNLANAQSLKELLYSGKLKSDTGSVVRKTDDLSTKIDTSTRKPPPPPVKEVLTVDSSGATVVTRVPVSEEVDSTSTEPAKPRDNDEIWKEYTDELMVEIKREILPNRKIKEGTYSILIVYEIDVDGQVNINTVSASPSNDFLADQIRNRMTLSAPNLSPLLNQYGKPRKAIKRQTLILTK